MFTITVVCDSWHRQKIEKPLVNLISNNFFYCRRVFFSAFFILSIRLRLVLFIRHAYSIFIISFCFYYIEIAQFNGLLSSRLHCFFFKFILLYLLMFNLLLQNKQRNDFHFKLFDWTSNFWIFLRKNDWFSTFFLYVTISEWNILFS